MVAAIGAAMVLVLIAAGAWFFTRDSKAADSPKTAQTSYEGTNGKIALVRENQIYTIDSDGIGLTQLTLSAKNYWPRWSPDGGRIAYVHETRAASKDIWVMAANGSHQIQVTHLGSVTAPTWSPNGKFIAFGSPLQKIKSTVPFGHPIDLLGSYDSPATDLEQLPVELGGSVAWSPDGHTIAYASHSYPDSSEQILTFDTVTHEVAEFNPAAGSCCSERFVGDLAWSPDGTKLGYRNGSPCPDCSDDPIVSPAYVTVESWPALVSTYPAVDYDKQPAFSPSGTYLAIANAQSGTLRIYITLADGTTRRLLTDGYEPNWQPIP